MPDARPPIAHLRQVAEAAERGVPLPKETAAWVAGWAWHYIRRAEAGGPISLERAAGLGAPRRPNWLSAEAKHARNAAVMDLRRTRLYNLDDNEAARAIMEVKPPIPGLPSHRQFVNVIRRKE